MRNRSSVGFVEPCLPSPAERPPAGPNWIHEIKHDGFRIMARRDGAGVRLFTRNGNDFTARFPLAAAAIAALPGRSFLIDGEAIVTNDKGLAVFELIRRARNGGAAVLCAFDLIELAGEDLRRAPIEYRKHKLARLVPIPPPGIVLNEHYEGDGEIVFAHAYKLGCERIVSKRLGSLYRSGRSAYWVKLKNPKAPAAKREAEEDWGRQRSTSRKPEAAYFVAEHGHRCAMMFFDMNDASDIPSIVEPLFVGLNAKVQLLPAMNSDDLKKGLNTARQAM